MTLDRRSFVKRAASGLLVATGSLAIPAKKVLSTKKVFRMGSSLDPHWIDEVMRKWYMDVEPLPTRLQGSVQGPVDFAMFSRQYRTRTTGGLWLS